MTRRNRALCVKVARDVLAQLRLKRYSATPGDYISVNDNCPIEDSIFDMPFYEQNSKSFKTVFKEKKSVTCTVCALGAAFVSLVNIKNDYSLGAMTHTGMNWGRLEALFGGDNLNLMESAFEQCCCDNAEVKNADMYDLSAAAEWGLQYENDEQRLANIMRNVVRNNGDFKLPQKFVYKANRARREEDREYV